MRYDVAVLGAGPAGLAAAATAAGGGKKVVVLDLAARTGGQFYRHAPGREPGGTYARLMAACRARGVRFRTGQRIFLVTPGFTVHANDTHGNDTVDADAIVIATGAHDRVVPFPGWDLPGVMTAGGAQSLLKGHGVVPGKRIVVAGTGPFLLPVAAALAAEGARVRLHEANSPAGFARFPRVLAGNADKIGEAARYLATLARRRVPVAYHQHLDAAHGDTELTAVTINGHRYECDILAVGHGFTPQIDIGTTLGCVTHIAADGTLVLSVDGHQATDVPGVYAAGEVTGVGGVRLAMVEGAIAGLGLSGVDDQKRLARLRRRRATYRAFADPLAAVYPPPRLDVTGDTTICRCEEVDHDTIRTAVTTLGARDPRAVKLLTRAGMGWCQGRMCGEAVACVLAQLTGATPDHTGFSRRVLAQPVRLGDLAADDS